MAKGYHPTAVGDDVVSLTHVCFDCRQVAKGGDERTCPTCRAMMFCVGTTWKTPKKSDNKGWRVAFQTHGHFSRTPEMVLDEWRIRLRDDVDQIVRSFRKQDK